MGKNRKRVAVSIKKPLVDIVIVTGGSTDMLFKCIASIRAFTHVPYNIIVIDNASGEMDIRKSNPEFKWEGIQVRRLLQPVGFAEANNIGARMGNAPLILLLNDDVELTDGCVDTMVSTMDNPQWTVVGAKLLFPETSSSPMRPAGKVQHVGHGLNVSANIVHPLVGWDKDHPKTCISREVISVTGACLMTRREVWNRLGGLDTIYGAGTYEEVDYCLKVKSIGGKIYVNTDAVAYHYTGATSERKNQPFPLQLNFMTFISRWSRSGLLSWDDWKFW